MKHETIFYSHNKGVACIMVIANFVCLVHEPWNHFSTKIEGSWQVGLLFPFLFMFVCFMYDFAWVDQRKLQGYMIQIN